MFVATDFCDRCNEIYECWVEVGRSSLKQVRLASRGKGLCSCTADMPMLVVEAILMTNEEASHRSLQNATSLYICVCMSVSVHVCN